MGDKLHLALRRAVAALQQAGTDYALIGGFAAAVRGRMRFTQDLDILCVFDLSRSSELIDAFRQQGFAHMGRADHRRLDEVDLFRFWLPVEGAAVSVGVDLQVARAQYLEAAVQRGSREMVDGLQVVVAAREDLILLKMRSWRPIDRADALDLAAIDPSGLDWERLAERAAQLGVKDRLSEVRAESTKSGFPEHETK